MVYAGVDGDRMEWVNMGTRVLLMSDFGGMDDEDT
jgi:hypothetical protein